MLHIGAFPMTLFIPLSLLNRLSVYSSYSPSSWLSFLPFSFSMHHPPQYRKKVLSLMKTHFRFSWNGPPVIRSDIIWEPLQCFHPKFNVLARMFFMFSGTTRVFLAPFKYTNCLTWCDWNMQTCPYEIVSFQGTVCVIGLLTCSVNFYEVPDTILGMWSASPNIAKIPASWNWHSEDERWGFYSKRGMWIRPEVCMTEGDNVFWRKIRK